jgi:hypothetical protein
VAGDSGLDGWGLFFVYLVAAWLCLRNARGSVALTAAGMRRVAQAQSRRRFWGALAALILLLGISRQFDLQALAASAMRGLLLVDDVYGRRSGLQSGLIVAIGSFGMIGLLIALITFRRAEASVLAALVAAAFLIAFTIIRTVSLHDIDHVLAIAPIPFVRVDDLIELGLLAVVALACLAFWRALKSENESARLRALSINERRRMMGEKRRSVRS